MAHIFAPNSGFSVLATTSSSGFSANFNKLKALALELGVHGQRCAHFDQDKISVCADGK